MGKSLQFYIGCQKQQAPVLNLPNLAIPVKIRGKQLELILGARTLQWAVPKRVLGVLAGSMGSPSALAQWAASAEWVVAADGGADRLLGAGAVPNAIVGDLDSASDRALACGAEVIGDSDLDRTDCDKLLAHLASRGCEAATILGFEGDRFDHMLASLLSIARSPLSVRVAIYGSLGWVLGPGQSVSVPSVAGRSVSLLPLGGGCVATLAGVRWPLESAELGVAGLWSVSNEALGPVTASVTSGHALLQVEFPESEVPWW